MAKTLNLPLIGAKRHGPPSAARTFGHLTGQRWLALVAAAFALAQLVLVRPGMGLGWDETVYVSQVSRQAPAAFFSAPRARGVPLLVAPIASWSSSTTLLRIYLALLSGLALFLALRVWRGLFPVRVLAMAGALFATLWVTVFYGPQAMPNYWVAMGALACVGCFLRAQADRSDRAALWGVGPSTALMAWMRPTDAVWVTLPLLVVAVAVRRWRRPRLLLALVAGLAAGAGEWVVEAYVSYGGLGQRLADASRIQGGLGWNIAVGDQLRSLDGRTLCRPCTGAMPDPVVMVWWFALPLLAAAGIVVAVKARRAASTLLPLACASTAGFPYLFMIGYAAPRFLLPVYALLAIPVADALVHLVTTPSGVWRPVAATLVALGLVGHLAVQYAVLAGSVRRTTVSHRGWANTAAELHRLGVLPPCLLTGRQAVPIAFYAGCSSVETSGHNANVTPAGIVRAGQRMPVAALTTSGGRPPAYARDWEPHVIGNLRVYVAPGAGGRAA
ncbi:MULTISPECIES: hypothetical protein [Streptomyces]|uniref:Integral membrane protein n=1 Tax=Streptomyces dengpaensis TaxID=2049881 RepID=A0ABM6SMW8_9ACTN|nr:MULTISPECIES: hypothetical protein [Streptomyces]AVH55503.1 hypothetical protein C4B68_06610 [Streptomyces dengpaensis]PIB11769.1 hypothetical protein B1C81_00580 [Streptomyces sp. HG99]